MLILVSIAECFEHLQAEPGQVFKVGKPELDAGYFGKLKRGSSAAQNGSISSRSDFSTNIKLILHI